MPFTMQLPTYQVETQSGSTLFPSQQQADKHYQKYVEDNVPCEYYVEGELLKEFKPT